MDGAVVVAPDGALQAPQPLCANCSIRPRYTDPATKSQHAFCGRTCAKKAASKNPPCLLCQKAPKCFAPGSSKTMLDYCSDKCRKNASAKGPCLLPIPPSDPKFQSVSKQFNTTSAQKILAIYKIIMSMSVEQAYKAYRATIAQRNNGKPNQQRRFHGTVRRCTLGVAGNTTFCNDPQCRLCLILTGGFKHPTPFTRANAGVYFAVDSQYSLNYCANQASPRAMILAKIVEGQVGRDCLQPATNHRVLTTGAGALPAYLIVFS
ncbi:hypothetical protein CF327_g115 [Tilletia walkeri]|uniref:PARP catalytic domain-containing protein n=1 Tax=Tilletia walkeri TaxID=117179 RepID=A0A8X7NA17_9BASI|nr:hypothetical protein CF327_g115 [Tilletia walkeri]KAE8269237.1 hypothetical protein A4X09_0g3105 [Tilletia walkeri]